MFQCREIYNLTLFQTHPFPNFYISLIFIKILGLFVHKLTDIPTVLLTSLLCLTAAAITYMNVSILQPNNEGNEGSYYLPSLPITLNSLILALELAFMLTLRLTIHGDQGQTVWEINDFRMFKTPLPCGGLHDIRRYAGISTRVSSQWKSFVYLKTASTDFLDETRVIRSLPRDR